jgi:hypothetical protein
MPSSEHRAERYRALRLLRDCGDDGATRAIMLAHGFTTTLLNGLVHEGLASVHVERMRIGEHMRLRITDAGRKAIGGSP